MLCLFVTNRNYYHILCIYMCIQICQGKYAASLSRKIFDIHIKVAHLLHTKINQESNLESKLYLLAISNILRNSIDNISCYLQIKYRSPFISTRILNFFCKDYSFSLNPMGNIKIIIITTYHYYHFSKMIWDLRFQMLCRNHLKLVILKMTNHLQQDVWGGGGGRSKIKMADAVVQLKLCLSLCRLYAYKKQVGL